MNLHVYTSICTQNSNVYNKRLGLVSFLVVRLLRNSIRTELKRAIEIRRGIIHSDRSSRQRSKCLNWLINVVLQMIHKGLLSDWQTSSQLQSVPQTNYLPTFRNYYFLDVSSLKRVWDPGLSCPKQCRQYITARSSAWSFCISSVRDKDDHTDGCLFRRNTHMRWEVVWVLFFSNQLHLTN